MTQKDLEVLIKGVVRRLAFEYDGFNLDKEDLLSEGYLVAVEQMPLYDHTKGTSVNTYIFQQVSYRLRNYVARVVLKGSHGTEEMRRVSMDNVDKETSESMDLETKIRLDEFRLSLEPPLETMVFDALRAGYTYREIEAQTRLSTTGIARLVKKWGVLSDKG